MSGYCKKHNYPLNVFGGCLKCDGEEKIHNEFCSQAILEYKKIVAKLTSDLAAKDKRIEELEDSDSWREKATDFWEGGNCPICFGTDEAGHKENCFIQRLIDKRDKLQAKLDSQQQRIETLRKDKKTLWGILLGYMCDNDIQQALTKGGGKNGNLQ